MTRKAIVTASDSGIGKASAVELARAGCDVGVTWHEDEQGAEGTAEEIRSLGRSAEVRRLDLTDAAGSARTIEELGDALGGIDVFVNNAGTVIPSHSWNTPSTRGTTCWGSTSPAPSCADK